MTLDQQTKIDLQVKTNYKYVGVNTCYPMSVLVSRLIAVKVHFCQIIISVVTSVNASWHVYLTYQLLDPG